MADVELSTSKSDSDSNSRTKIVVLGASYAKHLHTKNIGEYDVINMGVGGNETHEMLERFEKDVISLNPKAVVIWGFINDIFRATPDRVKDKVALSKKNLLSMVELAKQKGITPILATEVTMRSPGGFKESVLSIIGKLLGKRSYAERINNNVIEINKWIRNLATEKNIQLLEFEYLLAAEDGLRKKQYAKEDGSHLTAEAYEVLNAYIDKFAFNL